MAADGNGHLGEPLEVLGIRGDDDVYVLRPPDDAPGVDGKAADQHKFHVRFRESAQKLIESRFSHRGRAAPTNRISL
jgi:hypothetical protein